MFLGLLLLQCAEARASQTAGPQESPGEQAPPVEDPLGRSTPQGTVDGLVAAARAASLERAAEYLDTGLRPSDRQELARKLGVVLDRRLRPDVGGLSNDSSGNLDDGLTNRDRVGVIESRQGNVEILLDRVRRGRSDPIWLFSARALADIPRLYEEIHPPWIEQYVPSSLRASGWMSLPLYRWLGIFLLAPLLIGACALSARVLSACLGPLLRRLLRTQGDHEIVSVGPLRLLMLAIFSYAASFVGMTLAARRVWHGVAEVLGVMALCWLTVRLVNAVAELSLRRLARLGRSADVALVRFVSRLSKSAAVLVAVLIILYLSDADLTAALTGLGVGGLAIGFGAQKTIENLFGGIMVISDKPVNIGDACRMGEVFGTVEDIGIRSTRIRTLDRTVISVPNGQLAAMSLESFARRDRFRFQHTVGLQRQTTTDRLQGVLAGIRRLLEAHPKVDAASARTRLIRFSGVSLDIEVFAYVLEKDESAFLAIQEELLLAIMDVVDRSGTSFAGSLPAPVPIAAMSGTTRRTS